jgi:hypothetical protein
VAQPGSDVYRSAECPLLADSVEKVVLRWWSEILRAADAIMWGASSPHVKLTGDLANVSGAIRIGDCYPFRNFAKN